MPKNEDNKTPSLDALLEISSEDSKSEDEKNSSVDAPTESFENAELEALRAQLAEANAQLAKKDEELENVRNHPTDASGRPLPEEALTDEQKAIRLREDRLAREKGKSIDTAVREEAEPVTDGDVLIHVLEDGLTAMGRSFYRGEEIVFGPKAFSETLDRDGNSWVDLDDEEQYSRWGVVKFRKGPWPGKKQYEDSGAENKSIRSVAKVTRF